jgi:hypothetical protein
MNRVESRGLAAAHTVRGRFARFSMTGHRGTRPRHLVAVVGAVLLGAAALGGCQPGTAVPATPTMSAAVVPLPPAPSTSAEPATATTVTTIAPPTAVPPLPTTHAAPAATHAAPAPHATVRTTAPVQRANPGGSACGPDTYRNVDGRCVHRPVQAPGPPAGASARCRDGSYSFSQHRSGTCSGHGGVAQWL